MSGEGAIPKAAEPRPYLVFWTDFEMSRQPQSMEHITVRFAYSAADALVDARLTVCKPNQTIFAVRPPLTDGDHEIVKQGRQLMARHGGHGYTLDVRGLR